MRQGGIPLDGLVLSRAGTWYRQLTARPDWPFVAAGLLLLGALVELIARTTQPPGGPTFALVLALALTLPVALARTQPTAAAILIEAGVFLTLLAGFRPPLAGLIALTVVVYLVSRRGSRRTALLLVAPFLGYTVAVLGSGNPVSQSFVVLLLVLATGAATLGISQQSRVEAARRDASARVMADSLLEHAARGERARIARELHDVVAHHISMIAVQAEAARLTTPGMPPDGAKRLVAIGDTARTALTEMRRLLGVLREDASAEPTRQPQPGLQQLNELLDEARALAAGCTRLIVRGRVAQLGPGVEVTAYRIVQEALTNARRHAPGAAVDVELDYGDDALHVRVRDNGPGPPTDTGSPPAGHGLAGMRERAAAVGGRLSIGPASTGGFLVEAVLPTTGAEQ